MQNFKNNLITIITVVKNAEQTIEKCILSVLNQKYDNIEYIILDGGSTDKTTEIIKKYKKKIDKIIIEPDKGIWDAMNKGLNLASGSIIGFLNADDYYYSNSLEIVNRYFQKNSIDFLFGSVMKYKLMHGFRPSIIKWSFGFYTSHSVGFFIKTDKHREVGNYNSKYLSADLDFFYKMITKFNLKGKSTDKNEILGEFEEPKKLEFRAVFLDISKAFDKVWHEGLLFKHKENGYSGKLLGFLRFTCQPGNKK